MGSLSLSACVDHVPLWGYRIDSNFTIKVADFGLSRDIYARNYYQGGRGEKVPARWMPVESLVDGLWSEKSDIVS